MKNSLKLIAMATALSSCATIFSGTTQKINVQAVDEKDNKPLTEVTCTITDADGVMYAIPSNPGSVFVKKGNGNLTPNCKKDGYIQKSFGVGSSFNALTLVNVLFWPGLIVDLGTGAMHKYPSHISVFLEKETNQ